MTTPIEPFKTGYLSVGDGNELYWEVSGNPSGEPALYLHGGPGGGISGHYRRHFDPHRYRIVSFEQRGCGRSRPSATDPAADLATNTTQALVADIELLRAHLEIDRWLILGISWGTTLALAYAVEHPARVTAAVLAAIHLPTAREVEWITEDLRRVYPAEWARFAAGVDRLPSERLIDAYHRRITTGDRDGRLSAARAWCEWEDAHVSLDPQSKPFEKFLDPEFALTFATLVTHYWKHAGFIDERQLLEGVARISHLPCVLIHGRLDISSPLETAWKLHKLWLGSELIVIPNEGHGGKSMFDEITRAVARKG